MFQEPILEVLRCPEYMWRTLFKAISKNTGFEQSDHNPCPKQYIKILNKKFTVNIEIILMKIVTLQ